MFISRLRGSKHVKCSAKFCIRSLRLQDKLAALFKFLNPIHVIGIKARFIDPRSQLRWLKAKEHSLLNFELNSALFVTYLILETVFVFFCCVYTHKRNEMGDLVWLYQQELPASSRLAVTKLGCSLSPLFLVRIIGFDSSLQKQLKVSLPFQIPICLSISIPYWSTNVRVKMPKLFK